MERVRALLFLPIMFTAVAGLSTLPGCYDVEEKTEIAVVADMVYTPGQSGSFGGLSSSGDLIVGGAGTSDAYAIVFECAHGRFVIKRRKIWERFHLGDTALVTYREAFNKSGESVALDFVDAVRR